MLAASADKCSGGLSPSVPSAELALPQQGINLPALGLQTRRLRCTTAAVGRHAGNLSLINVSFFGMIQGERTAAPRGR